MEKDDLIPADVLLLYTSNETGVAFVDTMNLDGETNLKEKMAKLSKYEDKKMVLINGIIRSESANENLERWDGLVLFKNSGLPPL